MSAELRDAEDRDAAALRSNARRRVVILVASILGVLALVVWAVTASRGRAKGAAGSGGSAGMKGTAGMNGAARGSVRLTSDQIRQFGITFGTAEIRPITSEVRAAGAVTIDETKIVQVVPRFGGFVEALHVDFTGQAVRRGQPLLEIFSPDLLAAQQELLLAADLQRDMGQSSVPGVPGGSNLVESAKRRLRLWDFPEAQIDDVLRTGRARRTLTLYAPSSGVVVDKKVVRGQAITAGEPLYTIADLTRVWIDVQLRETDAAAVRVGSGADIEFAGLAGRAFKGRVAYVYPTLDQATRTVRARVAMTNAGGEIKPGMYAMVRVTTPGRSALTVPSSAVLRTGERNVVFVDIARGELMPRDVELGRTAGDYTEVLAGLEPGQRVATSAQFLLDSESNLGEVMKAMVGQAGIMKDGGDAPGASMPGMEMNQTGADTRTMRGVSPSPPAPPKR